jgi:TET-Associated Glycosyltransferase
MQPMTIIIPTYRRVNRQKTYNKCLSPYWQRRTVFVVDKEDAKALQAKYNRPDILVHPKGITTIAQKRAWILSCGKWDKLVMLDDDLRVCIKLPGKKPYKIIEATKEQMADALTSLEAKLEEVVHAGICQRQGNHTRPFGWEENARMIYSLGYRASIVSKECILGRIEIREDIDVTLQLLRKGYPNAVLRDVCLDQTAYNSEGGASSTRTLVQSNSDAEKLARLHPGFVRVVSRKYKTTLSRKEVIVGWKKAFKSSQFRDLV